MSRAEETLAKVKALRDKWAEKETCFELWAELDSVLRRHTFSEREEIVFTYELPPLRSGREPAPQLSEKWRERLQSGIERRD